MTQQNLTDYYFAAAVANALNNNPDSITQIIMNQLISDFNIMRAALYIRKAENDSVFLFEYSTDPNINKPSEIILTDELLKNDTQITLIHDQKFWNGSNAVIFFWQNNMIAGLIALSLLDSSNEEKNKTIQAIRPIISSLESLLFIPLSKYCQFPRVGDFDNLHDNIPWLVKKYDCLAVLRIDQYNFLRQSHGEEVADSTLEHLIDFLKNNLRNDDQIHRIDTDTLLLFFDAIDSENAEKIISRLNQKFSQTNYVFQVDGTAKKTSLSFCAGIATISNQDKIDSTTFYSVLLRADLRLSHAIVNGPGTVFYNEISVMFETHT